MTVQSLTLRCQRSATRATAARAPCARARARCRRRRPGRRSGRRSSWASSRTGSPTAPGVSTAPAARSPRPGSRRGTSPPSAPRARSPSPSAPTRCASTIGSATSSSWSSTPRPACRRRRSSAGTSRRAFCCIPNSQSHDPPRGGPVAHRPERGAELVGVARPHQVVGARRRREVLDLVAPHPRHRRRGDDGARVAACPRRQRAPARRRGTPLDRGGARRHVLQRVEVAVPAAVVAARVAAKPAPHAPLRGLTARVDGCRRTRARGDAGPASVRRLDDVAGAGSGLERRPSARGLPERARCSRVRPWRAAGPGPAAPVVASPLLSSAGSYSPEPVLPAVQRLQPQPARRACRAGGR